MKSNKQSQYFTLAICLTFMACARESQDQINAADDASLMAALCPTVSAGSTCTVNDSNVNIRSAAQINPQNIILVANNGDQFKTSGKTSADAERCWVQIQTTKGQGWASAQFLDCGSGGGTTPTKPGGPNPGGSSGHPLNVLYRGDAACPRGKERGCEDPLLDGYESTIAYPPRTGDPICGPSYTYGEDDQVHLAGYSSGRLPLLRRLAERDKGQSNQWAILIDPSWEDGLRDFTCKGRNVTGASIVKTWLQKNSTRHFLIVYSSQSTGWSSYVNLASDAVVGQQVSVACISVGHFSVPGALTNPNVILKPEAYANYKSGSGCQ